MGPLKPLEPYIYALTRIMIGLLFMAHGTQKLFGWFGGSGDLPPLIMAAGVIELIGGLLVAVGLFAGPAAFLCSGTMAVAYFQAHFPRGFFPIENKGELAVVYCWIFLLIAAKGSGTWSLDSLRGKS